MSDSRLSAVAVEGILASILRANDGALIIPMEMLLESTAGKAIEISYDEDTDSAVVLLIDAKDDVDGV